VPFRRPRARVLVNFLLRNAVLAALARLRPNDPGPDASWRAQKTWLGFANVEVRRLSQRRDTLDDAAILAMQLGQYPKAVRLYERLASANEGAIPHYNLACAYARASRDAHPDDARELLRAEAVRSITRAVESGYLDWVWMNEDRDLDPIRDDPQFHRLVEKMKASFLPKPVDLHGGTSDGRPPGYETPRAPMPAPMGDEGTGSR